MSLAQFNELIPVLFLDSAAAAVVVIIAIASLYKLRRWMTVLPANLFKDAPRYIRTSGLITMFFSELGESVLMQRLVFSGSQARRVIHMVVFWGFLGLAFATIWDDIFYNDGVLPPPFSFENFGNVVGNIAGGLVIIGMTIMILRYAIVSEFKQNYKGDLSFLIVLYLATITGFVTEATRFSPSWIAYNNYAIHLIFVGALLVTAPFTHFFHAVLTPFLRYVERVHNILVTQRADGYPFYRRLQMAKLADDVRDGKVPTTYPVWLEGGEKDRKS